MELPNYNKQLMQQLGSLRKEGQFCDCSILVGDNTHRAHKLVLAASSLLFRSLLEGSESISIDTAVVSSQEFCCLLDIVYTGKLPPGKHNFTRIIAAADSLHMFDVAVGCKNILTNLMKQSNTITATTTHSTQVVSATLLPTDPQPASTTTLPTDPQPASTTTLPTDPQPASTTTLPNDPQPASTTTLPTDPQPASTTSLPTDPQPASTTTLQTDPQPASTTTLPTDLKPVSTTPLPTDTQPQLKQLQSQMAERTASPEPAAVNMVEGGENTGPHGAERKVEVPGVENRGTTPADIYSKQTNVKEKSEKVGPLLKRARLQLPQSTAQADLDAHSQGEAKTATEVDLRQWLKVLQMWDAVSTEEKQVILSCCEGDPGGAAVFQRFQSILREKSSLSAKTLITLLGLLKGLNPNLATLLQEHTLIHGSTEAAVLEEPQCSTDADVTIREEEPKGERVTRSKAKRSMPFHPVSCRWCSKVFDYKCRLVAHAKRCTMSQEAKLQCPECAERLTTPRALQLHHNKAHPESKSTKNKQQVHCDICGRTFSHPSGMLYHKRTEHFEEKPYACEECGAKFGANSSLKNHMRLHTGEKPYHCKSCDMSFSVAAALAYHTKKKHSEGKMYSCQYCEALFAQSIELTRHVRTHTGDKPYVCRECGKGFSQANGLSAHLHTSHNISEPHDCQKCRLSFPSLDDHRKHIQEFHPKEFHQCPECSKSFTNPALLQKHIAVHAGAKPYSCHLCQKSYQQMSGLWYHNRTNHPEVFAGQTHRQLKSLLQCSECCKFFPTASSLTKHQKAEHPGMFDSDGLDVNPRLPSDPSVVKCLYCPEFFPSEAEMQQHASDEHFNQEGAAFGCSLCPLVCPSQLQLQEHFLSCHIKVLKEQASTSQTGLETETDSTGEPDPAHQSQQVFVAVGDEKDGRSSSEVMAVNMEDLLNGTVTFICEEGQ
ncbi:hypothetical protein UPYG_G00165590 [Umbra pygmaea]|uniref:Zinc finger and BTB domain-containing protein 40 n=1 Tax=Umbra pygmaea TaxID=75934 RepID=A0ABD0WND1_UMBPY